MDSFLIRISQTVEKGNLWAEKYQFFETYAISLAKLQKFVYKITKSVFTEENSRDIIPKHGLSEERPEPLFW